MNSPINSAGASPVPTRRCITTFLPLEALTNICTFLPRESLRSVRLVCRNFDFAARPALFGMIYLKLNLRSFLRCQAICRHEAFSKHVRAFCFDPRELYSKREEDDFLNWRRYIAGTGMGIFEDDASVEERAIYLDQYSQDQLKQYYSEYYHFIEDFEFLLRHGNWKRLLENAARKVSGLSEVYFSEGNVHQSRSDDACFNDELPAMGEDLVLRKQILAEPALEARSYMDMWRFLDAFRDSGRGPRIKKITGMNIKPANWKLRRQCFLKATFHRFTCLQSLSLTFQKSNFDAKVNLDSLSLHLADITTLQSLCLRFKYDRDRENPRIHYRILYLENVLHTKLPDLRKLELYGIIVTQQRLKALFLNHISTLRQVKLSHIEFKSIETSSVYSRKSWINLIQQLCPVMSLEYIEFDCVSICMKHDAVNGKEWYAEAAQAQNLDRYISYRSCVCLSEGDDDEDFIDKGAGSHELTPPGVILQAPDDIESDHSTTGEQENKLQSTITLEWIFGDRKGHFGSRLQIIEIHNGFAHLQNEKRLKDGAGEADIAP